MSAFTFDFGKMNMMNGKNINNDKVGEGVVFLLISKHWFS